MEPNGPLDFDPHQPLDFESGSPQLPQRGLARRLALLASYPRLGILIIFFIAILTLLTLRLYKLQIVQADQWRRRAQEQRASLVRLPAPRGIIYSRGGDPLVRNVPSFRVVVVPAQLPDDDVERETVLRRLAAILGVPYSQPEGPPGLLEKVEAGLATVPYEPLVIADSVARGTALVVAQGENLSFPGVRVEIVSRRQYPYGSLVSQLVGYLGAIPPEDTDEYEELGYDPATDRIGYAGVEASFEDWLHGQPGQRYQEEDVVGRVVRVVGEEQPPIPGNNVYLTIDMDLQQVAQDALWRGMNSLYVSSRRGVVIAMDPRSGEILAMVSLPTYDNNLFARGITQDELEPLLNDPHRPLINHAISDHLPPGSIFKIIPATPTTPVRPSRSIAGSTLGTAGWTSSAGWRTRATFSFTRSAAALRRPISTGWGRSGWRHTLASLAWDRAAASSCRARRPAWFPQRSGSGAPLARTGPPATRTIWLSGRGSWK